MQQLLNQNHLQHSQKINLGAFYTPCQYVEIVWSLITPFLNKNSVIFDSSCGYGNFFANNIKQGLLDLGYESNNIFSQFDDLLFDEENLAEVDFSDNFTGGFGSTGC